MIFPPMPHGIAQLPQDERGFPVPWFVEWIDGKPDFRVTSDEKRVRGYKESICWICGTKLFRRKAFTIGPMCAINRVSSEPAAHPDCCKWSASVCPFLTQPRMKRNEKGLVEGHSDGIAIKRNPGVALVWVTNHYEPFPDGNGGFLFQLGEPVETHWFSEGRVATREEVMASIDSGLPLLQEMADADGPEASAELARAVRTGMELIPA